MTALTLEKFDWQSLLELAEWERSSHRSGVPEDLELGPKILGR